MSFPDKWLGPLLQTLDDDPEIMHVPATIEREALGIAVGAQLAGMRSALVMQNSGIGNLLNDWASLAYNYGIPIPWIVSDRGSTGEQVLTQTIWHGRLRAILESAQILLGRSSRRQNSLRSLRSSSMAMPRVNASRRCSHTTSGATVATHAIWVQAPRSLHAGVPARLRGRGASISSLDMAPLRGARRAHGALHDEFLFVTLGDPCKSTRFRIVLRRFICLAQWGWCSRSAWGSRGRMRPLGKDGRPS